MPNGGKLTIETANVHLDEKYAASQAEVLPGQYVMLAVTDSGCGMTPEVKAKAFDPFFTTKDVGHGTGLGLSQVYGFVKQSRGHVKIYSEVGEGTTIKLYLPRVHAAAAADEERRPMRRSPAVEEGETILVVEDDADVRSYSSRDAARTGLQRARGGERPRRAAAAGGHPEDPRPVYRYRPAGRHERAAARRRGAQAPAGLKVLFTTGYARNAIVHDGRLDPGVELITKPFTQAALAGKLRDIIDAHAYTGPHPARRRRGAHPDAGDRLSEEAGFTVQTAGSATEAMNKLGSGRAASTP